MTTMDDNDNEITMFNSSLFLVLTVAGNFVAETLNCKTQKALHENMFLKNVVIFFVVYFTLNLTNKDNPHPFETFKKALLVWCTFFIFNRTHYFVNIMIFTVFVVTYVMHTFIKHYEHNDKNKHKHIIEKIKYFIKMSEYLLIFMFIVGFIYYFIEKRAEHGANWDYYKFIFGVNKCKSLT